MIIKPYQVGVLNSQRTDVLIVGAGPAGCMAAATLQRYDINFCLIENGLQGPKLGMQVVRE
jgi:phenol 2-monooxygenase